MSDEEYYKMVVEEDCKITISNKELALQLLKVGSLVFDFISDDLRKDRDVFLQGVKNRWVSNCF